LKSRSFEPLIRGPQCRPRSAAPQWWAEPFRLKLTVQASRAANRYIGFSLIWVLSHLPALDVLSELGLISAVSHSFRLRVEQRYRWDQALFTGNMHCLEVTPTVVPTVRAFRRLKPCFVLPRCRIQSFLRNLHYEPPWAMLQWRAEPFLSPRAAVQASLSPATEAGQAVRQRPAVEFA
jgi:hypothetical protein